MPVIGFPNRSKVLGAALASVLIVGASDLVVGQMAPAKAQMPGQMQGQMMSNKMPVDRAKVLTDTGVFGIFSVLKLRPEWSRLPAAARQAAAGEVTKVLAAHERVIVDAYLTRGLSEKADYLYRVHAYDLAEAQACANDLRDTTLGKNSDLIDTFIGVTKALVYASKDAQMLSGLRAASYEGPPPRFAIVIPTQKNAEWWNLSAEKRMETIRGHVDPTLAFLKTVKRKLYHSSGLDDMDWITYFETNDLSGFTDLTISLLSIPENKYNIRLGNPTLVGRIGSVDDMLKGLQ